MSPSTRPVVSGPNRQPRSLEALEAGREEQRAQCLAGDDEKDTQMRKEDELASLQDALKVKTGFLAAKMHFSLRNYIFSWENASSQHVRIEMMHFRIDDIWPTFGQHFTTIHFTNVDKFEFLNNIYQTCDEKIVCICEIFEFGAVQIL